MWKGPEVCDRPVREKAQGQSVLQQGGVEGPHMLTAEIGLAAGMSSYWRCGPSTASLYSALTTFWTVFLGLPSLHSEYAPKNRALYSIMALYSNLIQLCCTVPFSRTDTYKHKIEINVDIFSFCKFDSLLKLIVEGITWVVF